MYHHWYLSALSTKVVSGHPVEDISQLLADGILLIGIYCKVPRSSSFQEDTILKKKKRVVGDTASSRIGTWCHWKIKRNLYQTSNFIMVHFFVARNFVI